MPQRNLIPLEVLGLNEFLLHAVYFFVALAELVSVQGGCRPQIAHMSEDLVVFKSDSLLLFVPHRFVQTFVAQLKFITCVYFGR